MTALTYAVRDGSPLIRSFSSSKITGLSEHFPSKVFTLRAVASGALSWHLYPNAGLRCLGGGVRAHSCTCSRPVLLSTIRRDYQSLCRVLGTVLVLPPFAMRSAVANSIR